MIKWRSAHLNSHAITVPPAQHATDKGIANPCPLAWETIRPRKCCRLCARYPAYRNMHAALGCRVLKLPCGRETVFQPEVARLAALDEPPAGLVLASPANPTGTMV